MFGDAMVKRKTDFVDLIIWWGEAGNHSRQQQQQEEIKINFNYPNMEDHTVLNTVNTTYVWGGKVEDPIRMVSEVSLRKRRCARSTGRPPYIVSRQRWE